MCRHHVYLFFWQQEKFGHECISQKLNGLRDFERREREREAQLKGKEEGEYNKYKNQEPQKGKNFISLYLIFFL